MIGAGCWALVAVMLAGGGRCVADMATLRDQPALFGQVASDATIWRTFSRSSTCARRPRAPGDRWGS